MDRPARLRADFSAEYTAGIEQGSGIVVEISRTGARIDTGDPPPPIGSTVWLHIHVRDSYAADIVGRVSRHPERGFAIVFIGLTPEVLELLDLLGARG